MKIGESHDKKYVLYVFLKFLLYIYFFISICSGIEEDINNEVMADHFNVAHKIQTDNTSDNFVMRSNNETEIYDNLKYSAVGNLSSAKKKQPE